MTRPEDEDDVRAFRVTIGGEELAVLSIPAGSLDFPSSLTTAEREVCALVLAGHSNEAIAAIRRSAPRTVANQIASIFRKVNVSSRAELAASLAGRS